MYLEIDFPNSQQLDSVVVETSGDAAASKIKLDGAGTDGRWTTVADAPRESVRPNHISLRQAASAELKARGIRYLLITDDDIGAKDFLAYPKLWGMKSLAQQGRAHLYYIE